MTPLFSQEEFDQAKLKDLLPLKCKQCGETFYRSKHRIQATFYESRSDTMDYCGMKCLGAYKASNGRLEVVCKTCGIHFKKKLGQIKKSPNHYCSHSCAAKYQNTNRGKGTRRSKLEVWLETQLTQTYPDLEFHFNRTDAIESELDIYIPSLKLAFELNGIFHYEPIYGVETLDRIHVNDHRKMLACAERGIELCVIDTSQMRCFKEKWAQVPLNILREILDRAIVRGIPVP